MEEAINNTNLNNRIICKICNTGNDGNAIRCQNCWGRLTLTGFNRSTEPVYVSSAYEETYINKYKNKIITRGLLKWAVTLVTTLIVITIWLLNIFQYTPHPLVKKPTTNISNSQSIDDWSMAQKNDHHTGIADNNNFAITKGTQWKFSANDFIHTTPSILENTIYIGTGDNKIIALDKNNGSTLWEYNVNSPVDVSLSLTKEIVYAGLRDGRILALDTKDGNELWSYDTGEALFGSVTVINGAVFGGNSGKKIFSIDAATGELLWDFHTDSWIMNAPAVKDGVVAVGANDQHFYLIDAQNGTLRYKIRLGSAQNTPTIIDDTAYFTTASRFGSKLNAFNITRKNIRFADGFVKWWFQLYIWNIAPEPANPIGYKWGIILEKELVRSNLATDGEYLYVTTIEGNIRAIDVKDGSTLWKTSKSENIRSAPILSGSTLVQLMENGTIYGINKNDGSTVWQYELNEDIYGSAILVDNTLYVPTIKGNLYALE